MNPTAPLSGLWRRLAIEYPDGSGDTTSEVYWLQAGDLYADVRIPKDRPQVPAPELWDEVPVDELRLLAMQQGFAGHIQLQGDQCTWHRWLDFQPSPPTPDEGTLQFDGRMLVERGIHQPYIEHWWHEEKVEEGFAAFRLQGPTPGLLLIVGGHFMRAVGRRQPFAAHERLLFQLQQGEFDREQLAALLDCEISFGCCQGAAGDWMVRRSTKPWLEGTRLFAGGDPRWGGARHLAEPLEAGGERRWQLCESAGERLSGRVRGVS